MSPILHRWSTRAVAVALVATALAPTLTACAGGQAFGMKQDNPPEKIQAQILALESAQRENERLMGQALGQNAQMRDDVATALTSNRALEQRVAVLEARVVRQSVPEPPVAERPAEKSPDAAIRAPRSTPVAIRMPGEAQAPSPPAEPERLTVSVTSAEAWKPLYTNREGYSQKVRVKRVSAGAPSRIRLAPVGVAETPDGPPQPTWDLSWAGAEKWLRIGCGQEISARADDAEFEVLVRQDREPQSCPATAAGAH